MIEIKMPRLSDTMTEGAVATWHKQPGDKVAAGDVLVEIETDKAVMEYEAYQDGVLAEILIPEGQNADIGTPIALLDDGTGGPAPSAPAAAATIAPEREVPPPFGSTGSSGAGPTPAADAGGRQLASPLVRKLARDNHLDLSHVSGSGPGGRIIRADISGLLTAGPPVTATTAAAPAVTAPEAPAVAPAPAPAPASAPAQHHAQHHQRVPATAADVGHWCRC
jgi:pyruvate dehydrogenase E2 component (dihydrolipoamide acetyltransferase)